MAENAPPGSSKDAAADTSRGMPYYERLRRDLRESLQKKRTIDNNLVGEAHQQSRRRKLTSMCSSDWKTRSSRRKRRTSKRRAPATSSRASTTISKAQRQLQQRAGLVRRHGARLPLAMRTGYSVVVRRASSESHPHRVPRRLLPRTHPRQLRPFLRASRVNPQTALRAAEEARRRKWWPTMKMTGNRSSDRRSPMAESEGPTRPYPSLFGSILPAIDLDDG
jgi:hypothetical protein